MLNKKINNKSLFILLSLVYLSLVYPISLGYKNPGNYFLTLAILLVANFSKSSKYFIFIIFLLLSFYIPVGFQFGRINYGFIISAIETDPHEAGEFLNGILGAPLLLMLLSWIALFGYLKLPCYRMRRHYKVLCCLILVGLAINSYPKRMVKDVILYLIQSEKDLARLKKESYIPDSFTEVESKPKYKNIIVIVGESVSANYLSLYGYPHDNTSWMKNAPGLFMNNYVSAASNTFMSLPRTLAVSNGVTTNVNNNIVALANKGGYETYWISNQGFVGEYDTPSTIIAMRAKHRIFFKKGDYNSKLVDDFTMLDTLPDILNKKENKVIFIHMIGSHPNPCERLMGYPQRFIVSDKKAINCYIASINKLDDFVHKAYTLAKDAQQSFALTYFSDHGMTVDNSSRPVRHGNAEKQNYHVPFMIITDQSVRHQEVNTEISAYQFPNIFSELTGISSRQITPLNVLAIPQQEVKVFDGAGMVSYDALAKGKVIH